MSEQSAEPIMQPQELTFRVDNELNSIKGGGACQLREKVLAEAAKTWIIVADYRKNSHILGTTVRSGCTVLSIGADGSGSKASRSKSSPLRTPRSCTTSPSWAPLPSCQTASPDSLCEWAR